MERTSFVYDDLGGWWRGEVYRVEWARATGITALLQVTRNLKKAWGANSAPSPGLEGDVSGKDSNVNTGTLEGFLLYG